MSLPLPNTSNLVNYVNRVPVAADFSFRNGMWPICVNALNGDIYTIQSGTAPYNTIKKVASSSALGTVTNIATGTGLTGGPITTTGTISLEANGVTPAYLSGDIFAFAAAMG